MSSVLFHSGVLGCGLLGGVGDLVGLGVFRPEMIDVTLTLGLRVRDVVFLAFGCACVEIFGVGDLLAVLLLDPVIVVRVVARSCLLRLEGTAHVLHCMANIRQASGYAVRD